MLSRLCMNTSRRSSTLQADDHTQYCNQIVTSTKTQQPQLTLLFSTVRYRHGGCRRNSRPLLAPVPSATTQLDGASWSDDIKRTESSCIDLGIIRFDTVCLNIVCLDTTARASTSQNRSLPHRAPSSTMHSTAKDPEWRTIHDATTPIIKAVVSRHGAAV